MKRANIILAVILAGMMNQVMAQSCSVNTTPLNFGSYNVFNGAPLDTTGQITVSCAGSGAYSVEVALEGSNGSGSITNRKMHQLTGNDDLVYNLYTDAGRTTIWGNGSGNSATKTVNVAGGGSSILTVYGRVPALQDINMGPYADTVTVTISF